MEGRSLELGDARRPLVLAMALGLILAFALAGCSNPFEQTSVAEARAARVAAMSPALTGDDLVREGALTIGLVADDGAPYVIQGADGTYTGIDPDVGAALAQSLGLQADFVPIVNDAASALVQVDVVMGVSAEQAMGQVVASDYVEQATGFFTLGDEPTVASADELMGKTVGLQEGSASQQLLNASNLTMEQKGYENLDAAMEGLKSGEVDYVLCPVYPGAYLAHEMGGIAFCGTLDIPTTQGVGVSSGSQALAQAVQQSMDDIRDNGVLGVILAKWVGDLPHLTAESQVTGVVLADSSLAAAEQATQPGSAGTNAVGADQLPEETQPGEEQPDEYTEPTEPDADDGAEAGDQGEGAPAISPA